MACCEACARGQGEVCAGGVCAAKPRNVNEGGGSGPNWYARARGRFQSPMASRRGELRFSSPHLRGRVGGHSRSGFWRDAGALDDRGDALYDPNPIEREREEAAKGKAESIRRGVEALVYGRTAGDLGGVGAAAAGGATGSRAGSSSSSSSSSGAAFDPRDPASMTETRWRGMSADERTAWINANVRSEEQRTSMIRDAISGTFTTIQRFVDAEREKRLTEIREGAQTERERIRAQADTERARIQAEVDRARVDVERLRAERDAAAAAAGQATGGTPAEQAAAAQNAAQAQARLEQAQRDATAAQELATRREAELRELERQQSSSGWKWALGGLAVLVLGAGGVWMWSQRAGSAGYGYQGAVA